MARHLVFERRDRRPQTPLRVADRERQARELGACVLCGAPLRFHFTGPGCSGAFVSHEIAVQRAIETGAMEIDRVTVGGGR